MPSYQVPNVVGLTVAQAREEWRSRRERTIEADGRELYDMGAYTQVWIGFTGSITPASGNDSDTVTAMATTPPFGSFPTAAEQVAGSEWPHLPETASLVLTYEHVLVSEYLVTAGGDPLVTPAGDRLYVEV